MSLGWCRFLIVAALFFSVLVPSKANAQDTKTVLISTGEFTPWTDSKAKHQGHANRVIREAFKRQGYSVDFRFWPWKRAIEIARLGKVNATSYWSSDKNKNDFLYSEPNAGSFKLN